MKSLLIFFSLLSFATLALAQQARESDRFQLGLNQYSYFSQYYYRNLEDQLVRETPLRTRWGLAAESSLGEHFGLGLSLQYRRWQGAEVQAIDPRLMIIFVPVEDRYQEFTRHQGLIDLYGRWYVQKRTARFRTFAQLGLGSEFTLGGKKSLPLSRADSHYLPRPIDAAFNHLLLSLGLGIRYRINAHWRAESAFLAYWPGGIEGSPFIFNQYGLNLGLFRTF